MGLIDIIKPLSSVPTSAVNKSQPHLEKNSWEGRESNLGLLGVKLVCVPCKPPLKWSLLFNPDPTKADDAFYSREREIEEIVALLPEIREKIQDTRDMEAESLKKIGDKMSVEESLAKANGADGSSVAPNGGKVLMCLQPISRKVSF